MSDIRSNLKALQGVLWESLNEADASNRASLAREYRTTTEKLESLPRIEGEVDPIDELASRRATRSTGGRKSKGGSRKSGS